MIEKILEFKKLLKLVGLEKRLQKIETTQAVFFEPSKATGGGLKNETDPLSLHLDQTTPQTFSGGAFAGSGLLKLTSGLLGVDTSTYARTSDLSSYLPLAGGTLTGTLYGRSFIPTAHNTYDLGFHDDATPANNRYFNYGFFNIIKANESFLLNNLSNWKEYSRPLSGGGELKFGYHNFGYRTKVDAIKDPADWDDDDWGTGWSEGLPNVLGTFDAVDGNIESLYLQYSPEGSNPPWASYMDANEYMPFVVRAYNLPEFPAQAMKKIRLTMNGWWYHNPSMGVQTAIPFEVWYWDSIAEEAVKIGEYTHTTSNEELVVTVDCPCGKYIDSQSWITFYIINKNPVSSYVNQSLTFDVDYAKIEVLADLHISQAGIAGDLAVFGNLAPKGTVNITSISSRAFTCEDGFGNFVKIDNTPDGVLNRNRGLFTQNYLIDFDYRNVANNKTYKYQLGEFGHIFTGTIGINTTPSSEFALSIGTENVANRLIVNINNTTATSTAFSNTTGNHVLWGMNISGHTMGAGRRAAGLTGRAGYQTRLTSGDFTLVSTLSTSHLIDNSSYGVDSGTTLRFYGHQNYFNPTISSSRINGTVIYAGGMFQEAESDISGKMLNFALLTKGKSQIVGNLYLGSSVDSLGDVYLSRNNGDLDIYTATDKTIELQQPVYNDFQFVISSGKVGASNSPSWVAFMGNIFDYTFAVNDFIDLGSQEIPHDYKEGTNLELHLHWATNGLDTNNRAVKWEIEYSIGNDSYNAGGVGVVFTTATVVSAETVIPANTPNRSGMYTSIVTITGTNLVIGAQLAMRLRRITSTGTAPTNNPFALQVGCHYQIDTLGSRTRLTK